MSEAFAVALVTAAVTAGVAAAFTAAVREAAIADPANFDPRHFNKPARKYMKQVCLDRYQQFWAAGNASKIQQQSITYYAGLYAKGALDPKAAVAV